MVKSPSKALRHRCNMARSPETKLRTAAERQKLYRSAKISTYRFRKVLDYFVRDHTASDAARAVGLSINSVHAIYHKLRVFFFETGVFLNYYGSIDPAEFVSDDPVHELRLLNYHAQRARLRRGLKAESNDRRYHFAETCWRYDYQVMMAERPSADVHAMMFRHLWEIIRLCGPIGAPPRNRVEGLLAAMRQVDERIEWFRRSAPGFRSEEVRAALAEAHAIKDDVRAEPETTGIPHKA